MVYHQVTFYYKQIYSKPVKTENTLILCATTNKQ